MNKYTIYEAYERKPYESVSSTINSESYMLFPGEKNEVYLSDLTRPAVRKNSTVKKIFMAVTGLIPQLLRLIKYSLYWGLTKIRLLSIPKKLFLSMVIGIITAIICKITNSEIPMTYIFGVIVSGVIVSMVLLKKSDKESVNCITDPNTGKIVPYEYAIEDFFPNYNYFKDNRWWESFIQLSEDRDHMVDPKYYTKRGVDMPRDYEFIKHTTSAFEDYKNSYGLFTASNAVYTFLYDSPNNTK